MASQPDTKKPSAASRYLFLFLIGLVVGAVCTVMAMRALQARQDPFPHSVMHVMARHSAQLADTVKQNAARPPTPSRTYAHCERWRTIWTWHSQGSRTTSGSKRIPASSARTWTRP